MKRVEIMGLEEIGEVRRDDCIAKLIHQACSHQGISLREGDILVVAHKVVSKAEGRVVSLDGIEPSQRALELSRQLENKDPRVVEMILRESRRIVRMGRATIVVETHHGFICANAGVDLSNVGLGQVVLLPQEPDRSAQTMREQIRNLAGVAPAVIISDSFGRPWRLGTTDVALGVAGIKPIIDYRGERDAYGYELKGSVAAIADEIASAAELVMGKKDGIPVVLVRGFTIEQTQGSARDLLRPPEEDLFRDSEEPSWQKKAL